MFPQKKVVLIIIFLLINSVFLPVVTSSNITDAQVNLKKQKNERRCLPGPDLAIRLDNLEFKRFETIEGKGYSIYDVEYTVKNFGSVYFGSPLITLIDPQKPYKIINWWYESHKLLIFKGKLKSFSHEIKIRSDKDINYDEERDFAGRNIILDLFRTAKPFPDDPKSNVNFAKYWNDEKDYEPTLAHLLVSTPWRYNEKIVEIEGIDKQYIKSNNTKNLPNIINIERMGWIKNLSIYINNIEKFTEEILSNKNESFANESWNHLKPLIEWCKNVHAWFKFLIEDEYEISNILTLMNNLNNILINNITYLKDISNSYYSTLIPPVNNLSNAVKETVNWTFYEPWKKPIVIKGQIDGIEKNELINVTCRKKTYTFRDQDDGKIDNKTKYNFTVFSKPMDFENKYFEPHNCQILINGSKHEKNLQSTELMSYCFSGGSVNKSFDLNKEDKPKLTKNKESIHLNILNKNIFYKLKNIFSIFNNLGGILKNV